MQWTQEHSQWAEQHFDISSTTRSPATSPRPTGPCRATCSAPPPTSTPGPTTTSRPHRLQPAQEVRREVLGLPGDAARRLLRGLHERRRPGGKGDPETWQDGVYPMSCLPEGVVAVRKGGVATRRRSGLRMCSSPRPGLHTPERAQLFQQQLREPRVRPRGLAGPATAPGGSPAAAVLLPPLGHRAPTPLPPSSTLPGYPYQSHNLTPITPTPLGSGGGGSANSLKRKAFYMASQEQIKRSYGAAASLRPDARRGENAVYRVADNSGSNGFERAAATSPHRPCSSAPRSSRPWRPSSRGSTAPGDGGGPHAPALRLPARQTPSAASPPPSRRAARRPPPPPVPRRNPGARLLLVLLPSRARRGAAEEQLTAPPGHGDLGDPAAGPPVTEGDIAGLEAPQRRA
ncbi:unnamed protein product [Gadus morhua 'NCC']